MLKKKNIISRENVFEKYTWDLSKIFKSDYIFLKKIDLLKNDILKINYIKEKFILNEKYFEKGINFFLNINRKIEKLYVYSQLKLDQDIKNSIYQNFYLKINKFYTIINKNFVWFEKKILSCGFKKINFFLKKNKNLFIYKHFINCIFLNKKYILSYEKEKMLAGLSEIFNFTYNLFSVLDNVDIKFPNFKDNNQKNIILSHSVYEQKIKDFNRVNRRRVFKKYFNIYLQFSNTYSNILNLHLKIGNYISKIRKYKSFRHLCLNSNKIPEKVYDVLVSTINNNIILLHNYIKFKKKILCLKNMYIYDIYVPIIKLKIKFTYKKAKKIILNVLKIFGNEYLNIVNKIFNERYIDIFENKGKRSGAYSSGSYDTPPYILINWYDSLEQMYTLIHEIGHSVHSYFTHKYQPYVYGNYSIFLAEIASTVNENMLTEYLLKNEKNIEIKKYLLNYYLDSFKSTVFRQTQFAEFENILYNYEKNNIELTCDNICNIYQKLNLKYYSNAIKFDKYTKVEWARIPHFYYNYYVFQYATGYSIANLITKKILFNKNIYIKKYINFLKSGNCKFSIELIKELGIDIKNNEYLIESLKNFNNKFLLLKKIIKL